MADPQRNLTTYLLSLGREFYVFNAEQVENLRSMLPEGTELTVEPSQSRLRKSDDGFPATVSATPWDMPVPDVLPERTVGHTDYVVRHPWPVEATINGGNNGLVMRGRKGSYTTAFIEAYPDGTFIRGEGDTISDAEDAAWAKYQAQLNCPAIDHDYETRGYKNGAGFCKHCNKFASNVFTPEQLGLYCTVCGTPANWYAIGDVVWCKEHTPSREQKAKLRERMNEPASMLEELLEKLPSAKEDEGE